jgi:hypothetical protein
VALFALAISLTAQAAATVDGTPVYVDESLPKAPVIPDRLTFRERYASLEHYVRPIVRAARPARPVGVAVFGGRLALGALPWWAMLFVMVVIQAPAGDRRNWPAIRAWARELAPAFQPAPVPA